MNALDKHRRTPLIVALESPPPANIRAAIALIDAGADLEIYWGYHPNAETADSLAVGIGDPVLATYICGK